MAPTAWEKWLDMEALVSGTEVPGASSAAVISALRGQCPPRAPMTEGTTATEWSRLAQSIVTRLLDLSVACLLLLFLLPLLVLVAAVVWSTSPGPVFFRQIRAGRQGTSFTLWKFRTMREDADRYLAAREDLQREFAASWKLKHDPRITRIGHWLRRSSIDELPQLLNVIRGDMSLVGPRPVQLAEIESQYGDCAEVVFSVKPGLTGLWQVHGRSSTSYENRIKLDLEYVERRSVGLDLVLLLRTIPAVLTMRDAA